MAEPRTGPIAAILARHLKAHEIETSIGDLVSETALAVLWGVYLVNQNLRDTLDAAHRAATHASERRSDVLDATDVSAALCLRGA